MKKTDFTLFHSKKALGRFKYLTLSFVFTLFFLGLSSNTYAQGISATPEGGTPADVIFKDYDFIQDKSAALAIIQTEMAVMQSTQTAGAGEAEHALKSFYLASVGNKIKMDQTVFNAVTGAYSALQIEATKYGVSVDLTGIAEEVADLLD